MYKETNSELVGKNLRVLLALNQISITELSKKTGIARSTIHHMKSGNSKGVQLKTLNEICKYFDIVPNDLFL